MVYSTLSTGILQILIWKACKNWILTLGNLAKCKIAVDGYCPIYRRCYETTTHALWGCRELKAVRTDFGNLTGMKSDVNAAFKDFFFSCLSRLGSEEASLLSVVLWCNWFIRNQIVHGLGGILGGDVVAWCSNFLTDFVKANDADGEHQIVAENVCCWQLPVEGFCKINSDVAISVEKNVLVWGW
ncbi:hypothetical protein Dsin_001680 [Dipteronia sinensis]|uniref:Reverse transcriptase zinc-binding domain-containing protein n=1 Tax=Dipteronia sinensis TaxID=43782 RepID=A0AAE0B5V5_9ROSI|nr:hypothetical protein Dsin_001680 [Dipteronia sinensis]